MIYRLIKTDTGEKKVTALRESFKDEEGCRCERLVALFYDDRLARKVLKWLMKENAKNDAVG